ELIVLAVVVGLVVLLLWPAARAARRRRTPHDQGQATSTDPVPPRRPAAPVPGSREHRRLHGKP
ncbi:MAG TPA: hypothetical protein VFZ77_21280, partial [Acidimicrobiales bacterium]